MHLVSNSQWRFHLFIINTIAALKAIHGTWNLRTKIFHPMTNVELFSFFINNLISVF